MLHECVDANVGENVEKFARRLVALARERGAWVIGIHNDIYLRVYPESTWPEVIQDWITKRG